MNPRIDKQDLDTNISDTLPAHANIGRGKAEDAYAHVHTHTCVFNIIRRVQRQEQQNFVNMALGGARLCLYSHKSIRFKSTFCGLQWNRKKKQLYEYRVGRLRYRAIFSPRDILAERDYAHARIHTKQFQRATFALLRSNRAPRPDRIANFSSRFKRTKSKRSRESGRVAFLYAQLHPLREARKVRQNGARASRQFAVVTDLESHYLARARARKISRRDACVPITPG